MIRASREEVLAMYGPLRSVSKVSTPVPTDAGRQGVARARPDGAEPAVRVELDGRPDAPVTYAPVRREAPEDPALSALPRDAAGHPDPGPLLEDDRHALRAAVADVAAQGTPEARARYTQVIDQLLQRYQDDLSLSPAEMATLRTRFLDELTDLPARASGAPEAVAVRVQSSLAAMRDRVERRRDDVLTAAGDLGRLLAERVDDARRDPGDAAAARLGRLVGDLGDAAQARSTRAIRDTARERLRADAPPAAAPDAADADVGRRFLRRLDPA
jgi:hypothetical protein